MTRKPSEFNWWVPEFGFHWIEDFQEFFAPLVQGAELDLAIVRDDFERRAGGRDVPAGIPAGILVARGKIDTAMTVQITQKLFQALAERDLGNGATDFDPVRSLILIGTHKDRRRIPISIARGHSTTRINRIRTP